MSGVTDTGFEREELADIMTSLGVTLRESVAADLNLTSASTVGQNVGAFATLLDVLWGVAEEIYNSSDPDVATGASFESIAARNGVTRLPATKSTVNLTVGIDDGVTLEAGRIVSLSTNQDTRFTTTAEVSNATGYPGNFQVAAEAEFEGAVVAPSGTITNIETPQTGWDSVTNDAVVAAVTAANSETYAIPNGRTLTAKVDGGGVQTATFNVTDALLSGANSEPFALTDGWNLSVAVDGGSAQIATFNTADFANIAIATAAEVATVIAGDITGVTATDFGNVVLLSDTSGSGSSVHVTGGTANAALGFSTVAAVGTGDFINAALATAAEVVTVLNTDLTGATADDNGGTPRISSDDPGTGGIIEVTGGTLNIALGFPTAAISGYDANDAAVGDEIETEEAFRLRREELVAATGAATKDAITADVRAVDDVASAETFKNDTDYTDSNGVPPHAVEVLVLGGDGDEIAQAIWDSVAGGIQVFGSTSGTAVDANGDDQTVAYSRPTSMAIWLEIDLNVTLAEYPDGGTSDYTVGDDEVKAAIIAYGDALLSGDDVIVEKAKAAAIAISGVDDISATRLGFTTGPVGTANLTIGSREISDWATTRITVARV